MSETSVAQWCKTYFEAFSAKDLGRLEQLYAAEVALLDWEQVVTGRAEVLAANGGLFEQVDSLAIEVNAIHVAGHVAACEIAIVIDRELKLKVLDLLTWSAEGTLLKVDAYRQ